MPIFMFGSEAQKREWLPDLASGRKLAAFGLTEPGAGSDAGNTRTTAELRDGTWLVNGSKMFITNAGTDITWGVTLTAVVSHLERRPLKNALIVQLNGGANGRDPGTIHVGSILEGLSSAFTANVAV